MYSTVLYVHITMYITTPPTKSNYYLPYVYVDCPKKRKQKKKW